MIVDPTSTVDIDASIVGGKAYQLAKLSTFVAVPDFRILVPDKELQTDLDTLSETFLSPGELYAVRSSATVEDSFNASYAGLFRTELNIPISEIRSAVTTVINSVNEDRIKEYESSLGDHSESTIRIAVIIQKMVDATRSGVALSYAPGSNKKEAIIEAIFGIGELLVSGTVEPDKWTLDRSTGKILNYRPGRQLIKMTQSGNELVAGHMQQQPKLEDEEILEIINILFRVEREMGIPASDIEFCYKKRKLYLLQARPQVAT